MRITERKLKSIINSVISEMAPQMSDMLPQTVAMMPQEHGVEGSGSPFMDKAMACCDMRTANLLSMCVQICSRNPEMAAHCLELCDCVRRGSLEDCCKCLSEICKCQDCAQICTSICG